MGLYQFLTDISEGKLSHISADDVKSGLESAGSDFSQLTAVDKRNLSKFGSKPRGTAMKKIFGVEAKKSLEAFCQERANHYGCRSLPSGSNIEGVKGIVYDLHSYADGNITWERFEEIAHARLHNWHNSKKEDRLRVDVLGEQKAPASLPPGFALDYRNRLVECGLSES